MPAVVGGGTHAMATMSIQETLGERQTPLIQGKLRLRRPRTPVPITLPRHSERIAAKLRKRTPPNRLSVFSCKN